MVLKNQYQCCFCNKGITPSFIDITTLLVSVNWDKPEDQQHQQQFFCHYDCLKSKMYEGAPLYLEDIVSES